MEKLLEKSGNFVGPEKLGPWMKTWLTATRFIAFQIIYLRIEEWTGTGVSKFIWLPRAKPIAICGLATDQEKFN